MTSQPDTIAEHMQITVYWPARAKPWTQPQSVRYTCKCGWQHEGAYMTSHRETALAHIGRAHSGQ